VSAGRVTSEESETQQVDPGAEVVYEFEYVLPARDAEGVSTVDVAFSILDRRMDLEQTHRPAFEMGTVGEVVIGTTTTVAQIPEQRVFLMERGEDDERYLGGAITSLHESLLEDGRITIATQNQTAVAISECMETAGIAASERRSCELEWANRQLFDWALLVAIDREAAGDRIRLEVYDPHTLELVYSTSEDVSTTSVRSSIQQLGDAFRQWLRRRLQG